MKALLLVGSPRLAKSTSETLAAYLLTQLEDQGLETGKLYVHKVVKSEERLQALATAVAGSDLVIFASPLYVDSLPAPVVQVLESLADQLERLERIPEQRLVAISNSGFPEAEHNALALAIYERFASETGFVWAGGLALGGGEPVKNRPLADGGGMVRNVVQALDLAADALARGETIPRQAVDLMAAPLMPAAMYRTMGNMGWRLEALKNGVLRKLRDQVWEGR